MDIVSGSVDAGESTISMAVSGKVDARVQNTMDDGNGGGEVGWSYAANRFERGLALYICGRARVLVLSSGGLQTIAARASV